MFIKFSGKLVDVSGMKFTQIDHSAIVMHPANLKIKEYRDTWIEMENYETEEEADQRFAYLEEILCRQNIDSIVQAINNTICIR